MANATTTNENIVISDRVKIYPRGAKRTWTAEFWFDGQHRRKSLGTSSKKVAKERALELAAQLSRGVYENETDTRIDDAVAAYLRYIETEDRAAKTVVRYRGVLERFAVFAGEQRACRLGQVSMALLDAYRAARSEVVCPRSLYFETVLIKQLMKWSRGRKLVTTNPIADYAVPKSRSPRRPVLTLEQVRAILSQCSDAKHRMIATLAMTGMRVSSLQALRRADVDFERGWLNVTDVKKRQRLEVPIHPLLLEMLRQAPDEGHALLFTAEPSSKYPEGGRPISAKRLGEYFKAAAARAGIAGFHLHDLRHFFKSFAVNHGVPERAVDRWLGHSDGSVREVYYHVTRDESKRFMDCLQFGGGESNNENASAEGADAQPS